MKCNSCAKELVEDARFCPRCGRPIVGPDGVVLTAAGERSSLERGMPGRNSEVPISSSHMPDTRDGVPLASLDRMGGLAISSIPSAESGSSGSAVMEREAIPQEVPAPGVVVKEAGEAGKVMTSPFPPLPEASGNSVSVPGKRLSGSAIHTLLAQANLHRIRKEWTEGIDCCVVVLRAQPANQTAHVVLGDIYRDQRRLDEAIQWYQMAVELRPNPTDEAKLEGVRAERERLNRQNARRKQQGYDTTGVSAINRGTDLNTGTANLMGVSPRRWMRGLTLTSVAFIVLFMLVLIGIAAQNTNRLMGAPSKTTASVTTTTDPISQSGALPPHRIDRTTSDYNANVTGNSGKAVIVGGGGLAPDQGSTGTFNAAVAAQSTGSGRQAGNASPLLPGPLPPRTANPGAPGLAARSSLGPATVQNVRPLNSDGSANVPNVPTPPPSTRLTDGVEVTRTNGNVVVLTAPSALVTDGRGEEILVRNLYRAARALCSGNSLVSSVQVFVQAQGFNPNVPGLVVVMEGTLDRAAAMSANADTDAFSALQAHIQGFRWVGGTATAPSATTTPGDNPASDNSGTSQ